jgi:hypothetical protein
MGERRSKIDMESSSNDPERQVASARSWQSLCNPSALQAAIVRARIASGRFLTLTACQLRQSFGSVHLTQEGEAMLKKLFVRSAVRVSMLGFIGASLAVVDTQPSFAGCLGHCQVMKMCGDLVSRKTVKGDQKREEYQKCMRDPSSYK